MNHDSQPKTPPPMMYLAQNFRENLSINNIKGTPNIKQKTQPNIKKEKISRKESRLNNSKLYFPEINTGNTNHAQRLIPAHIINKIDLYKFKKNTPIYSTHSTHG